MREDYSESQAEVEHGERSSFMQKLRGSKIMRYAKIGAAAFVLGAGPSARGVEKGVPPEEDTRIADVKLTEPEEGGSMFSGFEVGAKQHLFEKNPQTGETEFQWDGLLAPVTVSVSKQRPHAEGFRADIPYLYSRMFDTGKPRTAEDLEKAREVIVNELKEATTEGVHAFIQGDSYEREAEHFPTKLTNIEVKGFTSPEARSVESPQPGVVDPENLQLGGIRAESAKRLLITEAPDAGVEIDFSTLQEIESNELQFSEAEMDELMVLAEKYSPEKDSLNQLYELMVQYNNGEVKDAEDEAVLHSIVNEKRKVVIDAGLKGDTKDTYVIPLPLLLLLPLIRMRRRGGTETPPEVPPVGPESTPEPPVTEVGPEPTPEPPVVVVEPEPIVKPERPDKTPDLVKRKEEEGRYYIEVLVDINNSLEFYEVLVEYYRKIDISEGPAEEKMYDTLVRDILTRWTKHDNRKRAAIGEPALDHGKNGRQVFYAALHAEALIAITRAAQAQPERDLGELWEDPVVHRSIQERIIERLGKMD